MQNHTVFYSYFLLSFLWAIFGIMLLRDRKLYGFKKIVRYLAVAVIPVFFSFMVIGDPLFQFKHEFFGLVLNFICVISVFFVSLATLPIFQYVFLRKSKVPCVSVSDGILPGVSVIICSRNEPFEVCKMTLDSAVSLDYPSCKIEFIVVDNSDVGRPDAAKWKDYVEALNQNLTSRFTFIHREGTEGFKAGNMDVGIEAMSHPYALFLDVDSTLKPNTLKQVMPSFVVGDQELGFVQLSLRPTNCKTSLMASIASVFVRYIRDSQSAMGEYGFVFCHGHNMIWRKQALDDLGKLVESWRGKSMVTEDYSMAIRSRLLGYRNKIVWCDSGEWVPGSLVSNDAMFSRWVYGNWQVVCKYFFSVFFSGKISFKEKFDIVSYIFPLRLMLIVSPFFFPFVYLHMEMYYLKCLFYLLVLGFILSLFNLSIRLYIRGDNIFLWISKCFFSFSIFSIFILFVEVKALYKFLINDEHGWKTTQKSLERRSTLVHFVLSYISFIGFSILSIALIFFEWEFLHGFVGNASLWVFYLSSLMPFFSLFVCLFVFSRSVTSYDNNIIEVYTVNHG